MSESPSSRLWLSNKNTATTMAETRSPATKPPENPLHSLPDCTCRKSASSPVETPRAAFVSDRFTLKTGNLCDDGDEGADFSLTLTSECWRIQSRICLRASGGSFVNLNPPLFCASSVHASSPPVSMNPGISLVCASFFPMSASIRWLR